MRKLRCILVCANLVVISALAGTNLIPAAGENLFPAGDCEKASADGRPDGWMSLEHGIQFDASNEVRCSPDAYQGKMALAIVLDSANSGWTAHPVAGLKPDTWYCLSAWSKSRLTHCAGQGPSILAGPLKSGGIYRPGDGPGGCYGVYGAGAGAANWTQLKLAFKTPPEPTGSFVGVGLYGARGQALFDDLRVEEISEAQAHEIKKQFASRDPYRQAAEFLMPGHMQKSASLDTGGLSHENLIKNGSFEIMTAPYMPDCWAHHILYPAFDPDFYENYRVVEDNPYHGRRCFRLKGQTIHFGNPGLLERCATNGVLTLYLRTDAANVKLKVSGSGSAMTFTPDKAWKPYVLKIPKLRSNRFSVGSTNVVYIDAVKLEAGDTPTPYSSNVYERIHSLTPLAPPTLPKVALKTVTVQGDAIPWDKGLIVNLQSEGGGQPAKPTRCVLLKGPKALFVRFECGGRSAADLVRRVKQSEGLLSTDDAVAVVLTPGYAFGSDTVYTFMANADGVRRQSRNENPTWRAAWEATAVTNAGGYDVTMTIPFASLEDGLFLGTVWRVNLIRYSAATDAEKREVSAWHYPLLAIVEKSGLAAAGFDGLDAFKVRIDPPRVLLTKRNVAPRPDQYAVVFPANFAVQDAIKGKAALSTDKRTLTTTWQGADGRAMIAFEGLTAREVTDLSDMIVRLAVKDDVVAERHFRERLVVPALAEIGPLDRNYYSVEKTAAIQVEHAVAPRLASALEWDLQAMSKGLCVYQKRFPATNRFLSLPVADWSPGDYMLRVNLARGDGNTEILAGKDLVLTKLTPGAVESKVDPIHRLPIVGGKPFVAFGTHFPMGSLKRNPDHVAHLQRVARKELGQRFVNVVMTTGAIPSNGLTKADCAHFEQFLDACRAGGLPVVVWLGSNIDSTPSNSPSLKQWSMHKLPVEDIVRLQMSEVDALKDRPEIIAWKSMDEIYGYWLKANPAHRESDLLAFRNALKTRDPYRLYWENSVYCGRMFGGYDSADVITASLYFGSPARVLGHMRQMETARARLNKRNVTGAWLPMWPQNWESLPSFEDLRGDVYAVLIAGGRWITFYTCKSFSQTVWDGFLNLKKEIQFLTPIFAGEDVSSEIRASRPQLAYCAWRQAGKTYLLTANMSSVPLPVGAFDLSGLGRIAQVKVCFENRGVKPEGGVIQDAFAAYERHVYEIE